MTAEIFICFGICNLLFLQPRTVTPRATTRLWAAAASSRLHSKTRFFRVSTIVRSADLTLYEFSTSYEAIGVLTNIGA